MESRYTVKFCLDGNMENVAYEESFESWDDCDAFVEMLPFDIIYANETIVWVDCGDEL